MADYRLHQTGDEVQRILDNATPQSELTAETERATNAENQLQQNIDNEQSAREQADIQLQRNIGAEAQTREHADSALQQLIQQVQASLINYYLKTETYSANQIDQMLAAIKQFRYQVVDQLPTPSADTMGIIYLVPSAHAVSGNIKDEYITLTRDEGSGIVYYFEQIGETAIDLSNYYNKAQTNAEITNALNTALANYSTTQQMTSAIATAIANYYTKAQVDAMIAPFITASVNNLVNYYLKSETFNKTEVQQMIAAVKQFRYQVAAELPTASADTVGIIYLIPSTNPKQKNVKDEFITIATTEQGSTTYSWEQIGSTEVDLSGYSTTEQMNAAIASAITAALAPYYTAEQVNAAISTALNAYYTKSQTDAAITAALNTALADYSTTQQMTAAIVAAVANYYTKTEVDALIANFITKSVNDLVNYYLKSETYSKDEVNQLIGELSSLRFEVADTLPEASASTLGAIYLVPGSSPTVQNIKDEYITLKRTEGGIDTYYWELIGSTAVDLSNYYTKAQTDAAITAALNTALADYSTTQQMTAAIAAAIAGYYTKQEVDALIANFITKSVDDLVNYYLKSDTYTKAEVQQLIAAVKQFTYQSVASLPTASADTMNIIYLVPSSDPQSQNTKDEYITIATTDQDVTTYAWEKIGSTDIDLSGYYTSQQTDAAISAALNTALGDYSTTQQMTAAINTAVAGKQNVITNGAIIGLGYGVCSTAAATPAKEVTIANFLLFANMPITVKFTNSITVANATLNISLTGAKPLFMEGTALNPYVVRAGMTATIIYDGTNYNIVQLGYAKNTLSSHIVDMGLPSGTLWAKENIDISQTDGFAVSEFQYECSFFSWGNIAGHNPISDSAFSYDFGSANTGPYASTPGSQLSGNVPVNPMYDIARAICGDPWRMPTATEFQELIDNCDFVQADGETVVSGSNKLVTVNGIVGIYLKSKTNGNLLFFPCSGRGSGTTWDSRGTRGYYWSGSLASATNGLDLGFHSGGVYPQDSDGRFYGLTGRAVQNVV